MSLRFAVSSAERRIRREASSSENLAARAAARRSAGTDWFRIPGTLTRRAFARRTSERRSSDERSAAATPSSPSHSSGVRSAALIPYGLPRGGSEKLQQAQRHRARRAGSDAAPVHADDGNHLSR